MTTITRNQAICMFYGEEYTDENVARLSKRIDEAEVDICYFDDPTESFLIWKRKINQNPLRYHRYTNEIPKSVTENEVSDDQTLLSKCKRKT
ncbi:hypothetical protein MFLAVUS_011218 [Mucor flavus]|uniref:Uncharacterized protein n=1 Tax=Mucor flavus TaxID=439312 RepID=A0ABP9ZEX5_9FUNG